MSEISEKLNAWAEGNAAALVLEQPLRPVIGTLVFPPTFAPIKRGDASDYVIDTIGERGVVTLDTPGAEANRLAGCGKRPKRFRPYACLELRVL